jgi:primosomal protein N' (replication factor Y)
MVVKGLDFDNVSLVGILDADGLLSFADFRVNERAFQLMEQVSGRAGRKGSQGKVLIQTMNVKHPVIQWVQAHDYVQMYLSELPNRKEFFYPPFSRLITITLKHKDNEKVRNAANNLAASLRSDFKQFVMGPAQPIIGRVRNQYLMEIIIKLPKDAGLTVKYKKAIQHHLHLLQVNKNYKAVVIVLNVDPV